MSSRTSKGAAARAKQQGDYDPEEYARRAREQEERERAEQIKKLRATLADTSIPLPSDLRLGAVMKDDTNAVEAAGFRVQPGMMLKVLRIIFFRGLDPNHSFHLGHWQTRCTLLSIRFSHNGNISPNMQAYRAAVEEGSGPSDTFAARNTFAAREEFVVLFCVRQVVLPIWTKGVRKQYQALAKWAGECHRECQKYYMKTVAAGALEHMDQRETEDELVKMMGRFEAATMGEEGEEIDELTAEFGKVMGQFKSELDGTADLKQKMELLNLVTGGA